MKSYNAIDGSFVSDDIEWLNVSSLVMRYADDPAAFDPVVIDPIDRIIKITFVDAIALFDADARDNVPQSSKTVTRERCFILLV